jgi:hypothetical protein
MGFWASLKLVATYLPQLLAFIKAISLLVEKGLAKAEVIKKCAQISEAFLIEDRQESARNLNDIFKK